MIILNVVFDTQCLSSSDLICLLDRGQVLHAAGILNVRWEEFSALDIARDAELTEVAWDSVSDDTPGTLELVVLYPQFQENTIRQQMARIEGVEDFDVWEIVQNSTEI